MVQPLGDGPLLSSSDYLELFPSSPRRIRLSAVATIDYGAQVPVRYSPCVDEARVDLGPAQLTQLLFIQILRTHLKDADVKASSR